MEDLQEAIDRYDSLILWRCPQLGGQVTFRYCRKLLNGAPCARIVGCWRTTFDVTTFLKTHYDIEHLSDLWEVPRDDKAVQLADLIERARKTKS